MKNFFNIFNCGVPGTSNDDGLSFSIFKTAKEKTLEVLNIKKYTIDFDTKIELVPDNFKKIIKDFKKYEKATPEFLKAFPDWSKARTSSVFQLKGLANEINTDRRNCNYTTIGSCAVGVIGAAVGVAAFIFPPIAIGLGIGGLVTTVVGGSTTFGTSVTEKALLNKCMKKAAAVVKSDEENFEPMRQWFEHAEDLVKLIDEMVGFDVCKEIYQGLKDCKICIENLLRTKDGELHPILKKLVELCAEKVTCSAIAAAATKEMLVLIPSVVVFFFVAILLYRKNNLMLGIVISLQRLALGVMTILDIGADLGLAISNIAMKAGIVATKEISKVTARMVAQGFVFGIGLVLDVANIAVTSYDIHKGSKSKHADNITKIADRSEEELKLLKSIYFELGGDEKLL